jgi:hypothetical protein
LSPTIPDNFGPRSCGCGISLPRARSTTRRAWSIANLDRDAFAIPIHLQPKWIGFIEIERLVPIVARGKDDERFTRREHVTTDVALGQAMVSRPEYFLERLTPIAHRLAIDRHDDVPDNGGPDTLVRQSEVNVRRVAAFKFQIRPDCGAHLLSLDVSGVPGDT